MVPPQWLGLVSGACSLDSGSCSAGDQANSLQLVTVVHGHRQPANALDLARQWCFRTVLFPSIIKTLRKDGP